MAVLLLDKGVVDMIKELSSFEGSDIGLLCWNEVLSLYPDTTQKQLIFTKAICEKMFESIYWNDNKIHVVPARCGFGKGNVQKAFLNNITQYYLFCETVWDYEPIRNRPYRGVIFVTDRNSRLEELFKYDTVSTNCYWLRSEKDSKIPLAQQFVDQQQFPILIMSTQRYFQMDPTAIRALKRWKNEEGDQERTLIIFDEKPYFLQTLDLNDEILNKVENALFHLPEELKSLDYTEELNKNQIISDFTHLKYEIFQEWENLTTFLQHNTEKRYTWIPPTTEEPSSSEFYETIKKVRLSDDIKNTITAIQRRKKNGCFYVNTATGRKQDRYYKIPMDNLSKFLTADFSYWVFDATAYNDVEYELLADRLQFEFYKVDDTKVESSKATHLVYNTSKSNMANKEKAEPVIEYVNTCADDTVIITYKELEQKIKRNKRKYKMMHFGDTKGYNDYRDATEYLQIGVNRQDDLYYFCTCLSLYPDMLAQMNSLSPEAILAYIEKNTKLDQGRFVNEKMQKILLSKVATDFEQNIFRTKLRQFGSDDTVDIKIICSDMYGKAITPVLKRYGISLTVDRETFYIEPGARDGSHADLILTYLASLDSGSVFTTQDIYNATGLSKHQFDKAKETHGIRAILTVWRTSKGKYRKPLDWK